jgi:hypothetical protein
LNPIEEVIKENQVVNENVNSFERPTDEKLFDNPKETSAALVVPHRWKHCLVSINFSTPVQLKSVEKPVR